MDQDFFLLQKMKSGDESAIDEFVKKYYPAILKYSFFHVNDQSKAEDITQDTFERFFRSFPDYRHYGKAKNYLYVIAGNLCKNTYRKRKEEPLESVPDQSVWPLDRVIDSLVLEQALRQLPEEMRDVLILHYYQDLKLKEIAKIQEIGLPLVKYRIKAAKERLREILGEEEL